ncbi:WecB/TagA/CpsF family glycosyltransferase [Priestia flexa]|uniref:WecB/TagA/CpsF family glycosyltransferase n=1 Tax=Priestia flexa TaxID=86664 RepID=UPI001CD470C9|nr:WecB/TagA/CpsF family glycosyltransferase [Priestia flexa]MCA1202276.1 WecB/TagA/CpsF family glycosyltransferase [Priestia flexa]
MIENVYFFDVKMTVGTHKVFLDTIKKRLDSKNPAYICISNVHTTIMATEDEKYKEINNASFMSITDGMPLVYISRKFRKKKNIVRLTGPDLMLKILEGEQFNEYKHFFYGSTNETLKKMLKNLSENYPHLNCVGHYSPPYRQLTLKEEDDIVKMINSKSPDFIWVGLGAPKQEVWMSKIVEKIDKGIMIGVGAAFDYHADNIKRAPVIMQKISLEWLYRLIQEPKRLFQRYFDTNTKFIYKLIKYEILKINKNGDEN